MIVLLVQNKFGMAFVVVVADFQSNHVR